MQTVLRHGVLFATTLCAASALAQKPATGPAAAAYPAKPVRLILGPAPGGPADALTRVVANAMSEYWGQQVVVDNRPGAGNTIAAAIAAKATPDGYTLHRCGVGDSIAPALYRKLAYDFMKDLAPIVRIGITPNIFVVHPSVPAKTVGEFIAHARAHPGKLDYAASGIGTSPQLSFELFKSMTGLDVVYVPYKSVALATTDLIAGRVSAQMTNLPAHVENVRNGKLRALAVTSAKRSTRMPDVPTIAESGVPGFEVTVWYGVCAPAGVDAAIRSKAEADLLRVLGTADLRQRMTDLGVDADPMNAAGFGAFIRTETAKWMKVARDAGIPQQ